MKQYAPLWLLLAVLLGIAGLGLLMELRWLDPTASSGRYFGLVFLITWCGGLLLLSLGAVRHNRSQFGLKTVLIAMAIVAAFLGAGRVFPVFVPFLLMHGLCSLLMLRESVRTPANPAAFRGPFSRGLLGLAGSLGLAHLARLIVHGLLA